RRSARRKSARRWWSFWKRRQRRSDLSIALLLALAQIIVGGAYFRALRRAERIEILLRHDVDAAVGAHLDDVEPLLGILEHPVLAFELGGHALDRAFDAERLAAADAFERCFLLDDAGHRGRGAEVDLRLQRDDFFRAGRLAQPALHAGVLGKPQGRPF